jgi:hypothetical protein
MFKPGDEIVYKWNGDYRPGVIVRQARNGMWQIQKPGPTPRFTAVHESKIMLKSVYLSPLMEVLKE